MAVKVTVDSATDAWMGNVGVVTKLIPKQSFDPQNSVAMICGPGIMMRFTVAELVDRGLIAYKDGVFQVLPLPEKPLRGVEQ